MLNGQLKGHQDLWQALVRVEKMFAAMDDEVMQLEAYAHGVCTATSTSFCISLVPHTANVHAFAASDYAAITRICCYCCCCCCCCVVCCCC